MQNPPGSYPPPPPGYQPGGFQAPGGYPGGPSPTGKTQTLGLDYNIAAGLCYLPICAINLISSILWIATEPKTNKLVRLHAFQSLFLGIFSAAVGVILGIAYVILVVITVALEGGIFSALLWLVFVAIAAVFALTMVVFVIMGLIKGFGGQYWKMPIIGKFAEKFA